MAESRTRSATYGLLFLAMGGFLLVNNAVDLARTALILSHDTAATGRITHVRRVHYHRTVDRFFVTVRFADKADVSHTFTARHAYSWWTEPEPGSSVLVRYRTGHPAQAVVGSFWHLVPVPVVWCVFGLGVLGLAFLEFRSAIKGEDADEV